MNYYGKITKKIEYNTKEYKNYYKEQSGLRYFHKKELLSQAFINIAFPCYDGKSPNIYGLDIIANILGGNMSSRLFIKLRERRGLIYNISAYYNQYSDIGSFEISCSTYGDEKTILRCITLIMSELQDMKKNIVKKNELEHSKNFINGDMLLYTDSSHNLADLYLEDLLLYNKIITYKNYKDNISKQTGESLKKISNDIFKIDKCNIGLLSKQNISKKKIYDLISKYI